MEMVWVLVAAVLGAATGGVVVRLVLRAQAGALRARDDAADAAARSEVADARREASAARSELSDARREAADARTELARQVAQSERSRADVAEAQHHMASAVERTHQPDPERVAEYELLYQRYLAWGAAAEPLYNWGVPA